MIENYHANNITLTWGISQLWIDWNVSY